MTDIKIGMQFICPPNENRYTIIEIKQNSASSELDDIKFDWIKADSSRDTDTYSRRSLGRRFESNILGSVPWQWLNQKINKTEDSVQISDQGRFLSGIDRYKGETGGPSKLRWL